MSRGLVRSRFSWVEVKLGRGLFLSRFSSVPVDRISRDTRHVGKQLENEKSGGLGRVFETWAMGSVVKI